MRQKKEGLPRICSQCDPIQLGRGNRVIQANQSAAATVPLRSQAAAHSRTVPDAASATAQYGRGDQWRSRRLGGCYCFIAAERSLAVLILRALLRESLRHSRRIERFIERAVRRANHHAPITPTVD